MHQNIDPRLAIELFKTTGFLVVNKTLINQLGLLESLIISNYVDKYIYFQTKYGDKFDGWFWLPHKKIMEQLNLKETAVIRVKKKLIEQGILQTKMAGTPCKEWIWIDYEQLLDLVFSDPHFLGGLVPGKVRGLLRRTNKEYNTSNLKKSEILITTKDFDSFWEQWPKDRRGSKGKAISSWIKLCASNNPFRPEWQRVRAAIKKQKKSEQWQNPKFIPLASTWLNQKRWLDDPKELKRYRFENEEEPEASTRNTFTDRFEDDDD